MVVKYLPKAIANHQNMVRKIAQMDLPESETSFLRSSLGRTNSYEKGILGPMFYHLGGGSEHDLEALKDVGDCLWLIRVVDNVVDGHITGQSMEPDARKLFLYGVADYISGISDEKEFRKVVPKESGVLGAVEVAKFFKESLHDPPTLYFRENLSLLARDTMGLPSTTIQDYENNLVAGGGGTGTLLLELVSGYPDFSHKDHETTRSFASDFGTLIQIADGLKDGDYCLSKYDNLRLAKSYWNRLKTYHDKEERFRTFEREAYLSIMALGLLGVRPYKILRNYSTHNIWSLTGEALGLPSK
ncbi:MAG: hypothetical protein JW727_00035 [Candidatus Aenigmarchaeota archaeon]|nr:hypothetical protein [Candidatus Aenigmarchaeota archaeon]